MSALANPISAAGQEGFRVGVLPRVGWLSAGGDLFNRVSEDIGGWKRAETRAQLDGALTLGFSVEVQHARLGLGLRATVGHTLDPSTSVHAVGFKPLTGSKLLEVPAPEYFDFSLATSLTEYTLELLVPTRFELPGVSPYLSAGFGVRAYDFQAPPDGGIAGLAFPRGGDALVVPLGLGVRVRVKGQELDVSVHDSLSEYWGEMTHQIRFFAGFSMNLLS